MHHLHFINCLSSLPFRLNNHQHQCCQLWFVFSVLVIGLFIHGAIMLSCVAHQNVIFITLVHLTLPLLMAVCIQCKGPFLGAFNFSSSSFCTLFFSSSICLQFSSCARTNILTKLNRVDTTT